MNTEGRLQLARKAVSAPGEAQEDWKIISLLAKELGKDIGFKSISDIRKSMMNMPEIGERFIADIKMNSTKDELSSTKFKLPLKNFYQTCVISRASHTMANCVDSFLKANKKLEAA
jgi:NADH dehydrogenase/NADH:ubiquinone oxidoreductase subunit G